VKNDGKYCESFGREVDSLLSVFTKITGSCFVFFISDKWFFPLQFLTLAVRWTKTHWWWLLTVVNCNIWQIQFYL